MREGMAEAEGVLMRDGSAEAQVEPMGVAHLGNWVTGYRMLEEESGI